MTENTERKEHSHEHTKHTEHKVHNHVHSPEHKHKKIKKRHIWQAISAILGLFLILSIFTAGFRGGCEGESLILGEVLSADEAADKAVNYINTNVLMTGQEATLNSVEDDGQLYKIEMEISNQEYTSYVTKDGNLLFPSVIDMEQEIEVPEETEATPTNIPKKEKPEVELFVMSHCPYGTQIEKGILPVAKLLKDKIDFEVKFVYYAMHDKTELDEQLLQYCIQKEQKEKYIDYLECFLGDGKSEKCLNKANIDGAMLENCVAETDEEFKITEQYEDESTWLNGRFPLFDIHKEENEEYSVRGSPALVVNANQLSSARDPASLLKTICSSFETPPEECDEELSSAMPAPGFGYETTNSDAQGTC